MRIRLLVLACTVVLNGCSIDHARPGKSTLQAFAEPARSEPFHEQVFGTTIDDPYRWMEAEANQDEMLRWIKASGRHTREQLHALSGRDRLLQQLKDGAATATTVREVVHHAERIFHLHRPPGANFWTLVLREDGRERVLVDPSTFDGDDGARAAIHNFSVSPDGRRVAFHVSRGGGETGDVRFIDVDSGTLLEDVITPVWGEFAVEWIDDDSVFASVMTNSVEGDTLQGMQVVQVDLGGMRSPALLGHGAAGSPDFEAREFPGVMLSPDGDWLLGSASGARQEFRVLLRPRSAAADTAWHEIADYDALVTSIALDDTHLYAISRDGTPNGRLLRLELGAQASLQQAERLVDESEQVLTSVHTTPAGVYLVRMRDGVDTLLFQPAGTSGFTELQLPFAGSISDVVADPDRQRMTLAIEGALQAPRHYELDGASIRPLGLQADAASATDRFELLHDEAISADGTRVPMSILRAHGTARNGDAPTMLYAYGAYGISLKPRYRPFMFPWLDRGGVWVDCHVRGGGEKGRAWHEAGRGANKPNGHADYLACAQRMIDAGWTRPSRLGGFAGSMGGVLLGPAALQRPDLFAFVLLFIAELNPTRILQAQNGMNQLAELGDPRRQADFDALLRMDPYLQLASRRDYPDTLVAVGVNDERVSPWQSAKFAARYSALADDGSLLLIRTDEQAGHSAGVGRDQLAALYADLYSFAFNRIGDPEFQPSE